MKQRLKTCLYGICFILIAAILAGCGNGEAYLPTPDIDQLVTRAVLQTVEARSEGEIAAAAADAEAAEDKEEVPMAAAEAAVPYSETAEIVTTEIIMITPPMRSVAPTATVPAAVSPTETTVPSATSAPSFVYPTFTVPAGGYYDKAAYEGQTPEDGTHVEANSEFDIAWYLLNTGTTTWNSSYTCRYFTGTDITKPGKTRYPIIGTVPPNAIGCCIVDAVAPEEPGPYKMSVVLGNENDENFTIVDISIWVD